jgi:hypothetical protein
MSRIRRSAGDVRAFSRYLRELPAFLARPLAVEDCARSVRAGVAGREAAFLGTLERAVYARADSPYRRLLEHAGAEHGDVEALVRDAGVEPALHRLYDAGVRLSVDEFKGRRPVERPGLAPFTIAPEDLDNPLLTGGGYVGRTSGSRGAPRRLRFELGLIAHEAAHLGIFLHSAGLADRPQALWRPVPPGVAGLNDVLRNGRLGRPMERWFTQYPCHLRPGWVPHAGLVAATRAVARRAGLAIPAPEHVRLDQAEEVAAWLGARAAAGARVLFNTTSSAGVRVAAAALDSGHDIAGTVFRLGGEPFTSARQGVLADAGCRGFCHYTMGEAGRVGVACAAPVERDDVHLLLDKLGVIQRDREVAGSGRVVGALVYTTLLALSPKVMLNVESDDYGVITRRECGCPLAAAGLPLHLHSIRSYEKLTSNGMTFLGSDLVVLVDDVLPTRFGGAPADWQLVEEEVAGLPRVTVRVSPRVGPVDEAEVVRAVLEALGSGAGYRRMMASAWRDGGTLAVERAEPLATSSAKVLPLHVCGDAPLVG